MNIEDSSLDISVENPGGLERRLTVKVPQTDIEREVDERLNKVRKTARLKGFRPGKVPPKVVRQQYGGQVRQEVLSEVIQSTWTQALEREQLNPAGGPQIEPLESANEEHFSYLATFEVFPEVELKPLAEAKIERPVVDISDADVEAMIEKLREQRAEWSVVERKSVDGDRVTVDFVGTVECEPFEGGKGEGVQIIIGGGQVIEDFDCALIDLQAGDSKTAEVKFPADYPTEVLAGKTAVFELNAHSVEEKHLPEVDEAFAKDFSVEDGSIDGLRAEVRKNMQREADERIKAETKQHVFNALVETNDIPLPQALINDERKSLIASAARRMGLDDAEKVPAPERFEPAAKHRVAVGLLLRELIKANDIELDQARVQTRIDELTASYEHPEEAAQLYRGSRELMSQIEAGALEEQVVDFVLDHASVTDKPVDFEELMHE